MVDITDFSRRVKRSSILSGVLFFGGALMMAVDFTTRFPTTEKGEFAVLWAFAMVVGVFFWFRSMELPMKEIMQLAEQHDGLLTVTEIATAMDISPDLVMRALRHLQARGLARVSLRELDRNLWEFPDSAHLPITQALKIAEANGGYLTVADLINAGVTLEIAQQTLAVLQAKGVLKEPSSKIDLPQGESTQGQAKPQRDQVAE